MGIDRAPVRAGRISLAGSLVLVWCTVGVPAVEAQEQESIVAAGQEVTGPAVQTPSTSTPSAPPETPEGRQTQDDKKPADDQGASTSTDRLFWLLPNFLTVGTSTRVPALSTEQKYVAVTKGSFDVVEFPWYGVLAGLSWKGHSGCGYGPGLKGYSACYGATFADGTIENFMVGAVLPSMLHTDPRYYQLGTGGVAHRVGYAVSRIVVTRTDSRRATFNFAEIIGGLIAASLANGYQPKGERTLVNTLSDLNGKC